MIKIRRASERGHRNHGWLDTHFTFSFADYYDQDHMGFRTLRVINEDRVKAGEGFGMHPHKDMEIITYPVSGAIQHKDSMGNTSVIRRGDVQRMSAGTGVFHSEFNPSRDEDLHLLQIWIEPRERGITPSYEERHFDENARKGRLKLLVSPDGADGSITINQDARVYGSLLAKGERVEHAIEAGRHRWIQVVHGSLDVEGETLGAGDGAAISDAASLEIIAREDSEFILFDLQ